MLEAILSKFSLSKSNCEVESIGNGLINHTWKVVCDPKSYILQRVNTSVFKQPELIDQNLSKLNVYLQSTHPDYLFTAPIKAADGCSLITTPDGAYRLFEYVKDSVTINKVDTATQAYQAAKQFGKFSKLLSEFDAGELKPTINDFHNLKLRFDQFRQALKTADIQLLAEAKDAIVGVEKHKFILDVFEKIQSKKIDVSQRVVHHDTKISNVLFNEKGAGLCVIDLDTVMRGYYISDIGDMMRSYLTIASEEETDFSKIKVREDIFQAIYEGYMSEMNDILSPVEKSLFTYSGKFLIYMQAIRFLTDYLNGDIYYGAKYEGHNLNRALNQLTLLTEYIRVSDQLSDNFNK